MSNSFAEMEATEFNEQAKFRYMVGVAELIGKIKGQGKELDVSMMHSFINVVRGTGRSSPEIFLLI